MADVKPSAPLYLQEACAQSLIVVARTKRKTYVRVRIFFFGVLDYFTSRLVAYYRRTYPLSVAFPCVSTLLESM